MGWGAVETSHSGKLTPELCLLQDDITPELQGCEGTDLPNHMFKQRDGTLLFEGFEAHFKIMGENNEHLSQVHLNGTCIRR